VAGAAPAAAVRALVGTAATASAPAEAPAIIRRREMRGLTFDFRFSVLSVLSPVGVISLVGQACGLTSTPSAPDSTHEPMRSLAPSGASSGRRPDLRPCRIATRGCRLLSGAQTPQRRQGLFLEIAGRAPRRHLVINLRDARLALSLQIASLLK